MSTVRAMAVFQGRSGLPADQFVNTFYFLGGGTYDEDALLAQNAVGNFYELASGGGATNAVGRYLTAWLFREYTIKTYDMTAPKVRVPTNWAHTLPAVFSADGLPEEAAVCLSLHGSTPPASARRRGRIYIGPLCNAAISSSQVAHPSAPSATILVDLTASAQVLSDTPLITWCIRSVTPAENYVPIVGGYVDNAFDTQRRRGPDASARTPWISSP